jgi:drug/metabolite transporter (DMT)-like permease
MVVAAVLVAAVLHASWNAIAHAVTDRLVGFAMLGAAMTACSLLALPFVPAPARVSWPYIGAAAALHVGYTLLLMLTYHIGDFGQVYPLARGISPLLVAVFATVVLDESLPAMHAVGVLVISLGLLSLAFAGGVPGRGQLPAIGAAVLTGVFIATYTVVDGVGVRHSGTAAGYTTWLFLLQGPVLPIVAVFVRRRELVAQPAGRWGAGLSAGALSVAAYALVLWAQTVGALASIAALRESSIIWGAVLATIFFKEPFGRIRIVASTGVLIGILLLAV